MIVSSIDWTKVKCTDQKKCQDLKFRIKSYHVSTHFEKMLSFYFKSYVPFHKNTLILPYQATYSIGAKRIKIIHIFHYARTKSNRPFAFRKRLLDWKISTVDMKRRSSQLRRMMQQR